MKIAIIGGNSKDAHGALNRDIDEFWGLNNVHPVWTNYIQWARWFNLHRYAHLYRDMPLGLDQEIVWARNNPEVPCYVVESWDDRLPNERIFPRKEMARAMPRGDYHCGSFDWMVAYATFVGATEIHLHGIGLAMESGEPSSAWACLEYWCGYAEGRGVKVFTAKDCDIFAYYHLVKTHKVYGYDDIPLVEDRT